MTSSPSPGGPARFGELVARAAAAGASEAAVREALAARRAPTDDRPGEREEPRAGGDDEAPDVDDERRAGIAEPPAEEAADPALARVVADADVLAADLLVGGPSRDALDVVRAHTWVTLVASDALLVDAAAVIRDLSDDALASDWRTSIDARADVVEHPAGDHPAIAAAHHGDARHVLSLDAALTSAAAGVAVRTRVETSVKHPAAFVRLFDPDAIYPLVVGGAYPGPDRDPRA